MAGGWGVVCTSNQTGGCNEWKTHKILTDNDCAVRFEEQKWVALSQRTVTVLCTESGSGFKTETHG